MRSLLIAFIFLCSASFVSAQTDTSDFTIKVFAGSDTDPPTTPTLLSATPIGPTQIDLAWTTATDNFVLGGYVVLRSSTSTPTSTVIATTTLTTYSDVGLSASSSYTYSVQAFDVSLNYSSTSNQITATTPNFPDPPTIEDAPPGTVARVVAEEVIVTPFVDTADFDITTKFPARIEIRWGRTASYELGYIASDSLRRSYVTTLTDLEPGTIYEYEIIGYTPYGSSNVIERGQFKTLNDIDLVAPANVKRFQALTDGADVDLSWELPDDDDIAYVRIVRSHLGYPIDPLDGATVYLGTSLSASDIGVLLEYSPAYYTAFVYDTAGNISSGAIAIAYADGSSGGDGSFDTDGSIPIGSDDSELATTSLKMPELFDFIIRQNNTDYSFADLEVTLSHNDTFLIRLPADRITRNLKTIIIELQDPTDQRQWFAFLLRLNKDQTAYEAVIAPLAVEGASVLKATVYDFRSLKVAQYKTQVSFTTIDSRTAGEAAERSDVVLFWQFFLTILLLLLVVIWWILVKDRSQNEDEDKATETETL